jgi:hypothetical protein
MSKTIKKLLDSRSWIAHIDDERNLGNSIIVTLRDGWNFIDEKNCGVKGFDTISELQHGTNRKSVIQYKIVL